ncbi:MAG TPA: type IV toxin-antitoxin system AbiEi family antitoxin domain-containing protein [Thermoleophilaceae bacterium]
MRETSRTGARKASGQKGLITRQELIHAGMSSSAIGRWIDKGLLIPEYPGVYRVGHAAPSTEATYLAAVLAAGDGAVLARRATGHLMRLLRGAPPPPELIARNERLIKGVKVKRNRGLDRRDVTVFNGIPTTTVARTLVDLAACLPEYELGRAWHQARVLYRAEAEDVEAVLKRRPTSKGAAVLRAILRGKPISLSRLESAFLKLLKDHNLEPPETNKVYGGRYVDCRWPNQKLTVELDSYRYHSSRHAWEQDRKRERQARRRGDDFRRFTSDDVFDDPRALLRELGPIIGR